MASIRKRGKSYQITVSNGRDIHDKQILETATWTPDPNKTEKQNQKALERFAMDFEARVQPTHLNKLYSTLLKELKDGKPGGYSPTTVKRVHAVISSIMTTAVQWNLITENPCKRIKPPKQAKQEIAFFTPEQAAAFLAELDKETKEGVILLQHNIFFQLALFCGLRKGETVALQWQDIDFDDGTISINKSTHEEKLPHVTPHGLRHTSATLLISQNIDIRTVSNRLGHAQTSTTMNIYTHALQKKDKQAAETLENLLIQKPC